MAPTALVHHVPTATASLNSLHYTHNADSGENLACVPLGWPVALDSPFVWSGEQFEPSGSPVYVLNEDEKKEIDSALRQFQALGLDGGEVGVHNFPLPTLGEQLQKFALVLHRGRGFFVLRGLDLGMYSREDNILIFLGVTSYIGSKRGRQDDEGRMISHIRLARLMKYRLDQRPIKDSNLGSAFHNDIFCDILAMQTHTTAAREGNHIIASAWRIYNELALTRPDLLRVLAAPDWPFDIRGRLHQTQTRPVLYYHNGRIIISMLPEALLGVKDIPRDPSIPYLTEKQMEALAAVQHLAVKYQLVLATKPGDLTFINNLALLHAREPFEDDEESKKCRYVVRLWLKNEEMSWELPKPLKRGNDLLFENEDVPALWNVAPEPRLSYTLRERFSP